MPLRAWMAPPPRRMGEKRSVLASWMNAKRAPVHAHHSQFPCTWYQVTYGGMRIHVYVWPATVATSLCCTVLQRATHMYHRHAGATASLWCSSLQCVTAPAATRRNSRLKFVCIFQLRSSLVLTRMRSCTQTCTPSLAHAYAAIEHGRSCQRSAREPEYTFGQRQWGHWDIDPRWQHQHSCSLAPCCGRGTHNIPTYMCAHISHTHIPSHHHTNTHTHTCMYTYAFARTYTRFTAGQKFMAMCLQVCKYICVYMYVYMYMYMYLYTYVRTFMYI